MYAIVEFSENVGGGLAIVNSNWLTPRKKEVFWPPTKDSVQFQKIVRSIDNSINKETWESYEIIRIFYETDDYEKAIKKLKLAEVTSDLNSDIENQTRKRNRPKRILDSSSDDEEHCTSKFERPPKIKFNVLKNKDEQINNQLENTSVRSSTIEVVSAPLCTNNTTVGPNGPLSQYCTPSYKRIVAGPINFSSDSDQVLPKILEKLVRIEVQNEQILNLLQSKKENRVPIISTTLPQLPVALPLNSLDDIVMFEEFLKNEEDFNLMKSYFTSVGGNNIVTRTNRILRQSLTNSVASTYNFFGRNKKRAFSNLRLSELIIASVKCALPQSTDKDVEDIIKSWLKHAPQRLKPQRTETSA